MLHGGGYAGGTRATADRAARYISQAVEVQRSAIHRVVAVKTYGPAVSFKRLVKRWWRRPPLEREKVGGGHEERHGV